jgi:hypothetical protein
MNDALKAAVRGAYEEALGSPLPALDDFAAALARRGVVVDINRIGSCHHNCPKDDASGSVSAAGESPAPKPARKVVQIASVHTLPGFSGDGYGYGGGCVLSIGDRAWQFGEGEIAAQIATRLAKLWNSDIPQPGDEQ